jgi:hypothetical protein
MRFYDLAAHSGADSAEAHDHDVSRTFSLGTAREQSLPRRARIQDHRDRRIASMLGQDFPPLILNTIRSAETMLAAA